MLGQVGQTHISAYRKNTYQDENGTWWYRQPNDGKRRRLKKLIERNTHRMYVEGHYISNNNLLHSPGCYESFEDAAFTNLCKKEARLEGWVYLMHSPSIPGWVKVGRAYNLEDRIAAYQTASPHRDYQVLESFFSQDCREAERDMHALFRSYAMSISGEWFQFPDIQDAQDVFNHGSEEI